MLLRTAVSTSFDIFSVMDKLWCKKVMCCEVLQLFIGYEYGWCGSLGDSGVCACMFGNISKDVGMA